MRGEGYEWDAELVSGPFDGLIDCVVTINGEETPPEFIKRNVGEPAKKSRLGEKVLEQLKNTPDSTKVAVYKLRASVGPDEDKCVYDYVEQVEYKEFRTKYKSKST